MTTLAANIELIVVLAFVATATFAMSVVLVLKQAGQRYQQKFRRDLSLDLGRVHLFIDPSRLLTINVLVAVGTTGLVYWLSGSLLAAVVVALVAGLVPRLTVRHLVRRRRELFRGQLPDLMLLLAAALRSGAGLTQAFADLGRQMPAPARQEMELLLREQRLGGKLDEVMTSFERRMPIEELLLLTTALRISAATGGNLAETLERLAESLRRQLALEDKVRALTAQGRLQAIVMSLLPILLTCVLLVIDPAAMRPLFETRAGWLVCLVVVLMLAVGSHFLRRAARVDV